MPWAAGSFSRGNGIHSGASTWADDAAASTGIVASRHDTHDEDLADGIDACLTKDSSNSPSSHLTWVKANYWGGTSAGSANAQTVSLSPAPAAYAAGMRIVFVAGFTNTGACTLNVNGLGAKNIRCYDNSIGLSGAEIRASDVVDCVYDGTQFILIKESFTSWQTWVPTYTQTGTMTFAGAVTGFARYKRIGKTVYWALAATGTTGGSADTSIQFALPFAAATFSSDQAIGSGLLTDGANVMAFVTANGANANVFRYDGASIGLGAGRLIDVSGVYEAA